MVRRIQLQKTVKKLLKIISGIDFFPEDHLKHGLSEILIRVLGIFDDSEAVLDFRAGADGVGEFGVILAAIGGGVDVEGEGGGGAIIIVDGGLAAAAAVSLGGAF